MYRAAFQCIAGCAGALPLDSIVYRCPRCGQLLDVVHDMQSLEHRSAAAWMNLFDARFRTSSWPYGSGVWGKKEWVAPHVDDDNVVSLFEGGTHLLWARRYGRQLGVPQVWIKQCGDSHSGSFKDLGMTVLVSTVNQMRADGKRVPAIACASTGDTSAALAAYTAAAGLRAIVILPQGKISTAQLVQPLANGALVLAVDTDFDGCMRLVTQLAENDGVYLANSMNSLRLEGQKTVAIEIVQQLGWSVPDWLIIPGGNLGNVSALGAGLQMMLDLGVISKKPRLCVAQAEHANPLYQSYKRDFSELVPITAKRTLASAIQIGNPISYRRAVRALRAFDGVVEQASEEQLANASARADLCGLFSCPHTGVALAALETLIARGDVEKHHRVVVISTANGLKFSDFKTRYHDGALDGISTAHGNRPVGLPEDYSAVREQVLRALDGA